MSAITYNPLCIRVGESIEKCMSLRAMLDGGITVTHHYASIAFMRDLDRDDALALYHWLGDHLMRSAATAPTQPQNSPQNAETETA